MDLKRIQNTINEINKWNWKNKISDITFEICITTESLFSFFKVNGYNVYIETFIEDGLAFPRTVVNIYKNKKLTFAIEDDNLNSLLIKILNQTT